MKNLLILACAFITSFAHPTPATSQEDAITKYYSQYADDDDFTTVFISPKMFGMITTLGEKDMEPEVKNALNGLKSLRILTTEKNPQQRYKEAMQKINTKEYEELMTVKDDGENVRFLTKTGPNGNILELLLIVGSKDEFVLLSFTGNIDLKTISKLSGAINVEGAQELEKLEKNPKH